MSGTRNAEIALFQSLSSDPATMEGSRAANAYGCISDYINQAGDAEKAYDQTPLKGDETLVMLPEKYWDPELKKMNLGRSAVRLVKALYGHPNAGA